jgi:hypothetical protein
LNISKKALVVTVPYMWKNCGKVCNHHTHYINEETLLSWSGGRKPSVSIVVDEPTKEGATPSPYSKRIIQVYNTTDANYTVAEALVEVGHINETSTDGYGPPGSRTHATYYTELFNTIKNLTTAEPGVYNTIADIGSGFPPFLRHVTWIANKTIVAPYFATYVKANSNATFYDELNRLQIKPIQDDFMSPKIHLEADMVICCQTLEHVPDPVSFFHKLLNISKKALVVTVPYMWKNCGKVCNHHTHYISEGTLLSWSGGRKPSLSIVVDEPTKEGATPSPYKKSR